MGMPNAEWKALVHLLKTRLPVSKNRRIAVRRCTNKHHGTTNLSEDQRQITICISKHDTAIAQRDALIHEWGHAMQYDKADDHDEEWGKLTAAAYRIVDETL